MQDMENEYKLRKPTEIAPRCEKQLAEAMAYIAESSLKQANIMHEQFYEKIKKIERMPKIGTKYENGLRKTGLGKFRKYNIYYRIKKERIEIVGIWHTSRGTEFSEE